MWDVLWIILIYESITTSTTNDNCLIVLGIVWNMVGNNNNMMSPLSSLCRSLSTIYEYHNISTGLAIAI